MHRIDLGKGQGQKRVSNTRSARSFLTDLAETAPAYKS